MELQRQAMKKVVVVHRGARDAYQVAAALAEAGLLECFVTDLYWPNDLFWAITLANRVPRALRDMLLARYSPHLPSRLVHQRLLSGVISHLLDKVPNAPFSWRRKATRWADSVIGQTAGKKAREADASLLSYSYYGYHAFLAYKRPALLFQAHPHPLSVRQILQRELEANPECADSLNKEWELSLPPEDFDRLLEETTMAAHTLAASSFTRQTLIEHGISADSISVLPYGVDLNRFNPGTPYSSSSNKKLKLLFVGTINQRKGIKYLLEAIRLVHSDQVELTVCGRVVDDLSLFKSCGLNVTVRPSINASELLQAYRSSDLFVFPSVVEGFGQVLLESLACGLPVLSTTRTAAPDIVRPGIDGFIVDPCKPAQLAERIEWALANRHQLREMRPEASSRGASFTWAAFRRRVVEAVLTFQSRQSTPQEVPALYA